MKKILIFLPLVSHASAGRLAALGNCNVQLHVVDTSTRKVRHDIKKYPYNLIHTIHDYDAISDDPLYKKRINYYDLIIDALRGKNILNEDKKNKQKIKKIIESIEPNIIVTYYGTQGAHYARIISKLSNEIPIMVIINLIPQTIEKSNNISKFIRRFFINEFNDYKSIKEKVYKFVCASREMKLFLENKLEISSEKIIILPDYHPKKFQSSQKLLKIKVNNNPKLIFMGAPERWGDKIDNIDDQFMEICSKGIEVYSGKMLESVIKTGFGHTYEYFSDDQVFAGDLSIFAQNFDAALITYNLLSRRERFRTTLPTRFFSAISAGIPIAVRAGVFDSIESFIIHHGNGFIYKDSQELFEILNKTEKMYEYRLKAIQLLDTAFAENQVDFLEKVISEVK
jgi:hypothetical protein